MNQQKPSANREKYKLPVTLPLADEMQNYETGGFKNIAHGIRYQLNLLMLVIHRACRLKMEFRLATEMTAAEKFDDIILECQNNTKHPMTTFIQTKHKFNDQEHITLEELLKPKGPFNMLEYVKSYHKMITGGNLARDSIQHVILYTNVDIDEHLKTQENVTEVAMPDAVKSIFQFKSFKKKNNDMPKFYKIKNICVLLGNSKKELFNMSQAVKQEFQQKFVLAVNQPNEEELGNITASEMSEMFSVVDSQQIVSLLRNFVFEWMSCKLGVFLTRSIAEAFFDEVKLKINKQGMTGVISDNQEKRLEFGKFFKTTEKLAQILTNSKEPILHIYSACPALTLIKIVQELKAQPSENYVVLNVTSLLSWAAEVHWTWNFKSTYRVFIECTFSEVNELQQAKTVINGLLNDSKNTDMSQKGIVLISEKCLEFAEALIEGSECELFEDKVNYDDLTTETQRRILNYEVQFQGKQIYLKDLVDCNYGDLLNEDSLNMVIEKNPISIGHPLQPLDKIKGFQIERKLVINLAIAKKRYAHKSGKEQEDLIKNYTEDMICVIEGEPGIGKSIELTHIALQEKSGNPNHYIIKINLLDHIKRYDRIQDDTLLQLLRRAETLKTEFEKNLLYHYVHQKGKVLLLFDGFDEIGLIHQKVVIQMLQFIKTETKVKKVWITSRTSSMEILERELLPAFYELLPFTINDQTIFLKKYWIESLGVASGFKYIDSCVEILLKELSKYKQNDITKVPLLIRIIAEIYESRCKEFCKTRGKFEMKIRNVNIYELFEEFVTKKLEIYFQMRRNTDFNNHNQRQIITQQSIKIHEGLHNLAFKLIFPYQYSQMFRQDITKNLAEVVTLVGIVQKCDDQLIFIHRTFAEYFVAEFLSEKLKQDNTNTQLISFLRSHYFKKDNDMVRYFLDHILAKDSAIHQAVLENNLNEVRKLFAENSNIIFKKDFMGRIPLHLACADGMYFSGSGIIAFLVKIKVKLNNFMQIMSTDILSYNPIAYAAIRIPLHLSDFLQHVADHYHLHEEIDFSFIEMQINEISAKRSNFFNNFGPSIHSVILANHFARTDKTVISSSEIEHLLDIRNLSCHINDTADNYKFVKYAMIKFLPILLSDKVREKERLINNPEILKNMDRLRDNFNNAFDKRDYAFLLVISLLIPNTIYKWWLEVEHKNFIKELINLKDNHLKSTFKKMLKFKKKDWLSKSKVQNYLVLALRTILHDKDYYMFSLLDLKAYFVHVAMKDIKGFEISLQFMNNEEQIQLHKEVNNCLPGHIANAIKDKNQSRLWGCLKYISKYAAQEFSLNMRDIFNADVELDAIQYIKECITRHDIMGVNYLLNVLIGDDAWYGEVGHEILRAVPHQTCNVNLIVEDVFCLINEENWKRFSYTLENYSSARARGYPFTLPQHIITHLTIFNKGALIPECITKYFDNTAHGNALNYTSEIVHLMNSGDIDAFLRCFHLTPDSAKLAILLHNECSILKNAFQSTLFQDLIYIDKRLQRAFITTDLLDIILSMKEYTSCLSNGVKRKDFEYLQLLTGFLDSSSKIRLWQNADYVHIFQSALVNMEHTWVYQLTFLLFDFAEELVDFAPLTEYISNIFNEDIHICKNLLLRLSFGKNVDISILKNNLDYINAFQRALKESNWNRLNGLYEIYKHQKSCLESMRANVETQDCLEYFKHFAENCHYNGVQSLLKYISSEEKSSVNTVLKSHGITVKYSPTTPVLNKEQWQTFLKVILRYSSAVDNGFPWTIYQYIFCINTFIVESVPIPKCIGIFFQDVLYITDPVGLNCKYCQNEEGLPVKKPKDMLHVAK